MAIEGTVGGAKNPWIAAALSLVPGAGQVYTGQWRKALYYFGTTLTSLLAAVLVLEVAINVGHHLIGQGIIAVAMLLALLAIAAFLVLLLLGLYYWGSAAVDAYADAAALKNGLAPSPNRRYFRL